MSETVFLIWWVFIGTHYSMHSTTMATTELCEAIKPHTPDMGGYCVRY